jgi:hypothetical protein
LPAAGARGGDRSCLESSPGSRSQFGFAQVKGREAIFWQAVYVEFLGVFTPEGGGDPVFGTFVGDGHVIAIPVN